VTDGRRVSDRCACCSHCCRGGCRVVRLLRDRVSVRASSRLALRGRDCRAAARTRTRGVARFDPTRATTGRAEGRRRNAERLALPVNGDVQSSWSRFMPSCLAHRTTRPAPTTRTASPASWPALRFDG
jgi:hypothetical protein